MVSKLHEQTKKVLQSLYPNCPIIEEYPIKVNGGQNLRIDLVVDFPFNVAVECQGAQHEKFVPHFHKDSLGFKNYQRRDRLKDNWCFEHFFALVYVYEGEEITKELLQRKIEDAERKLDKDFGVD